MKSIGGVLRSICPVVAIFALNSAFAAEPTRQVAARTDRITPFEVTVNGAIAGTWLFLERDGVMYASADALDQWRVLRSPEVEGTDYLGETWYPMPSLPGFEMKVNYARQSLELLFSPQSFAATRLSRESVSRPVTNAAIPSVFMNYDLNYNMFAGSSLPSPQDFSMINELAFSSSLGVLSTSLVGRNLLDDTRLGTRRQIRRLETTFTRNFPDSNRTLRIGDGYTRVGMLGRSQYFGGIQIGRDFGLTPGFVTQPLPVVNGMSTAPSTVELYVNDVLRQVSTVPTGPFAIDNFPQLTGGGDARLVVRDLLGRETVIEQPFFTSSQLLAEGLNDWSMEIGRVREELGVTGSRYGQQFVSGSLRRGISSRLTLEGHGEFADDLGHVQAGVATVLPFMMLGRFALAGSRYRQLGNGTQWLVALENQGLHVSAGLEMQGASRDFRQLGQPDSVLPVRQQIAGNWTYSSEHFGAVGFGFASVRRYDAPTVTTMSAQYTRRIGQQASLSFTASRVSAPTGSSLAVAVNFLYTLGSKGVVSAYSSKRGNSQDTYVTMSHNPGLNEQFGWRVLGGQQQNQGRGEAGGVDNSRYGTATADISNSTTRTAARLGLNGGLVFADGHLFASRRVDDSFAVVEVPGYGNIGVGIGNNFQTRTNADGIALIPRLTPYQNNSVRLNPKELPISAEIDSMEQLVVPAWRSAVKVTYAVRSGRGALLQFQLADGEFVPPGAIATIVGDDKQFYVARRGQAFITGLETVSKVVVSWQGLACTVDVELPPESPDAITRAGPLACQPEGTQ